LINLNEVEKQQVIEKINSNIKSVETLIAKDAEVIKEMRLNTYDFDAGTNKVLKQVGVGYYLMNKFSKVHLKSLYAKRDYYLTGNEKYKEEYEKLERKQQQIQLMMGIKIQQANNLAVNELCESFKKRRE
jgi:hypothetical protein